MRQCECAERSGGKLVQRVTATKCFCFDTNGDNDDSQIDGRNKRRSNGA